MKLFEDKYRDDSTHSSSVEKDFDFLDRSSISNAQLIREELNSWFSHFPVSEGKDLKNRFKKRGSFNSAFFELFVHEFFLKQRFAAEVHPTLHLSTTTPDFLFKKGLTEFYAEAKTIVGKTKSEQSVINLKNEIYSKINSATFSSYKLVLEEVDLLSSAQPKVSRIIKVFKGQLKISNETKRDIPLFYEDATISIRGTGIFLDLSAQKQKPRDSIIMYPPKFAWINEKKEFEKVLKNKVNKYGQLDKPFLICLNLTGTPPTNFGVINAFYENQLGFEASENDLPRYQKQFRKGIFNGTHENLSAVLITRIFPYNCNSAYHWLLKNPFARIPLDLKTLDLSRSKLNNSPNPIHKKKSIGEVLKLPKDWLEETWFK